MTVTLKVDTSEVDTALKGGVFTEGDMLDIEKPISLIIVNVQKTLVPVDTAATRTSIKPNIQTSTPQQVVDHIGPETDYAPYIELGVASKPNYPIQPFVRPSVFGNESNIERAAGIAYKRKIKEKYG